jgi:hypothetical protein
MYQEIFPNIANDHSLNEIFSTIRSTRGTKEGIETYGPAATIAAEYLSLPIGAVLGGPAGVIVASAAAVTGVGGGSVLSWGYLQRMQNAAIDKVNGAIVEKFQDVFEANKESLTENDFRSVQQGFINDINTSKKVELLLAQKKITDSAITERMRTGLVEKLGKLEWEKKVSPDIARGTLDRFQSIAEEEKAMRLDITQGEGKSADLRLRRGFTHN